MRIDTTKTKKAIRDAGYTIKGYARANDFSSTTFDHFISNWYDYPKSDLCKRMAQKLDEDGFLHYEN